MSKETLDMNSPSSIKGGLSFNEGPLLMETPLEMGIPFYWVLFPFLILVISWWVATKKRFAQGKPLGVNCQVFDGSSLSLRRIRHGSARFPALDEIYNWKPIGGLQSFTERYYLSIKNCQGVRNRFRIVAGLIRKKVAAKLAADGEVRILSIASGSAQCVFEALYGLKGLERVHVRCIDMDPEAIQYSKNLAGRYDIPNVEWVCRNMLSAVKIAQEYQPDIVEMVGFLDYLNDNTAVKLFQGIYNALKPGGCLITAHIHPNPERGFLCSVVDWDPKMLYRSSKELERLITQGGYDTVQVIPEPHQVHSVAIGGKSELQG